MSGSHRSGERSSKARPWGWGHFLRRCVLTKAAVWPLVKNYLSLYVIYLGGLLLFDWWNGRSLHMDIGRLTFLVSFSFFLALGAVRTVAHAKKEYDRIVAEGQDRVSRK